MEIIHIVCASAASRLGRFAHQLAGYQHGIGREVAVWHIADSPADAFLELSYPVTVFRRKRRGFSLPKGLEQSIATRGRQATFHLHGAFHPSLYLAATLLRERDIPYVVTPYGLYLPEWMKPAQIWKRVYFPLFELPVLRGAATIYLVECGEMEAMQEWFHSRKVVELSHLNAVVQRA